MTEARDDPPAAPRGRRAFLAVAAAAAGAYWWGGDAVEALFPSELRFTPMADPPGFRRMTAGSISAGSIALLGVRDAGSDSGSEGGPGGALAAVRADPCRALFRAAPGETPEGVVRIASFSDYNCPYCRVLTKRLEALAADPQARVRVTWHELPLLGGPSRTAARAALAADMQGAYGPFHDRLMRARFVPTAAYLDQLAEDIGVDADRLRADMDGPEVARRLEESAALASIFGMVGTPALVVGRTVSVGAIGDGALAALIARERADGPLPGCG